MIDVHLLELASRQHRCVSHRDLARLGMSDNAIRHRLDTGRLVLIHDGVYAVAPVLEHDRRTRWMAATLTTRESFLSHASAGEAHGIFRRREVAFEVVTRPGSGGPVRIGGVLVCRSTTLAGETMHLDGIPITTPERTAIDLAPNIGDRAVARMVRDGIRLRVTGERALFAAIRRHRGRRGTRRLYMAVSLHAGLPINRTRSDAEALALTLLREAGRPAPDNNRYIEGEEADLSWPAHGLIIEIDGPRSHLDVAEDARKEAIWRAVGWRVERIPSDDVYLAPEELLAIAPRG